MAATAYLTDAFRAGIFPDSNVPAGQVLCQFNKYTAYTTTYAADTVYMFRLPKNAVLVDLICQFDTGGSSGTLSVGTCIANSTTGLWNSPTVVQATNIVNAAAISNTGAGRFSLSGGYVSTSLLSSALLGTTTALPLGYKFSVETGIYVTFGTTAFPNDANLYLAVLYFVDYGADMAYDAVNA
jgi:hypothetical protein